MPQPVYSNVPDEGTTAFRGSGGPDLPQIDEAGYASLIVKPRRGSGGGFTAAVPPSMVRSHPRAVDPFVVPREYQEVQGPHDNAHLPVRNKNDPKNR